MLSNRSALRDESPTISRMDSGVLPEGESISDSHKKSARNATPLKHQPSATIKQLRSFGLIVGGIILAFGLWPALFHSRPPRLWAALAAAILILPALIRPGILKPVYVRWMIFGQFLGWINTRIILGFLFYTLFSAFGLFLRLLGKDPMHRRFDRNAQSYRVPRSPRSATHLKHQF